MIRKLLVKIEKEKQQNEDGKSLQVVSENMIDVVRCVS